MPQRSHELLAIALACTLSASCRTRPVAEDAAPSVAITPTSPSPPSNTIHIPYPAAPGSFVDLTAEHRHAVVNIRSDAKVADGPGSLIPGEADPYSLGSGVLIDAKGHVLTNDHVIAKATDIKVRVPQTAGLDDEDFAATVLGRDAKLDVALLKIDASPRLRPARLGNSDELQVGQWIAVLGNPFGNQITVTAGIASSLASYEAIGGPENRGMVSAATNNYRTFMQTTASIHAGNSGGPVLDMGGRVIGIASASHPRGSPIGFVIPINRLKRVLPMLEDTGVVTRAWLGAFVHPVSRDLARAVQLPQPTGALVSEVVAGAPAQLAGIKPRDIILNFDGHPVDHKKLPWIAASTGIGRTIRVVVWRPGNEATEPGKVELSLVTKRMPQ